MSILYIRDENGKLIPVPVIKGDDYVLTEADKAEIAEKVEVNCVAKNQGSANVGKILVVGTDGNLVLADMPEGGGDVTGVLDASNNILLSGNLANGTYSLKFVNEDGSYTDIGSLVVGENKPAYNNLANPKSEEWMDEYKLSSSGVVEKNTGTTLVNTITCTQGDIIRVKGMTSIVAGMYKNGTWYSRKTVNATSFDSKINPTVIDGDYTEFEQSWADVTELRFYGTLSDTAEDVIITVNQEIV